MNTNMQLTPQQQHAFQQIKDFIRGTEHQIFILKGYAGTGKTTLIKFVLDWLEQTKTCRPILLASTGRAAKVLENKAKYQAGTVHGHIYSFDVMDTGTNNQDATLNPKTGQLSLNFSLKTAPQADTKMLYIVDEASMLSHLANTQNTLTKFGSGNLLLDLFNFAQKHKIIFIGDPVQLPPPSGNNPFSPALDHNFLQQKFNKKTTSSELTQIIRQAQDNPILTLATTLRQCVNNKKYPNWEATLSIKNQHIQQLYTQNILTDRYLQCVGKRWDKAIILTHSNKQAFYLNKTMRSKIFKDQPPHHLIEGELLMVTQNSYYVPLSNGDQVIVRKVKAMEKRAGFAFLKVEIEAIHDHQIYNTLLLHDFLFKPEANLDPQKQRALLIDFDKRARKQGLKRNSKPYKDAMRNDKYLNALRAKFGYAVTCHKAQGGEWKNVFINLSDTLNRLPDEARFRWLYTAVTRAQQNLFIKPIWKGNKPNNKQSPYNRKFF